MLVLALSHLKKVAWIGPVSCGFSHTSKNTQPLPPCQAETAQLNVQVMAPPRNFWTSVLLTEVLCWYGHIRNVQWSCIPCFFFAFLEVSALFEAGTSITYVFQEPYPVTKNASTSSSAIYADTSTSKENIAFTFLTARAPSLLFYINVSSHDYLAVILSHNGKHRCRAKGPVTIQLHLSFPWTHILHVLGGGEER